MDQEIITSSPAVDLRIFKSRFKLYQLDLSSMPLYPQPRPHMSTSFLFHTSFCQSTLLSKSLHEHGVATINELLLFHQLQANIESLKRINLHSLVDYVFSEISQFLGANTVIYKMDTLAISDILMEVRPTAKLILLSPSLKQFIYHIYQEEGRKDWCLQQLELYEYYINGRQAKKTECFLDAAIQLWKVSVRKLEEMAKKHESIKISSEELQFKPHTTINKCLSFLGIEIKQVKMHSLDVHSKNGNQFSIVDYWSNMKRFYDYHPHLARYVKENAI